MSGKLTWVNNANFMNKDFWAPYKVNNDIDYYDDLSKKYSKLLENSKSAGADAESLEIIKYFSEKVKESVRKYYEGKISTSQTIIKNLLKNVMNHPLAVNTIYKSKAFLGNSAEIQFFRARSSERITSFTPKEMLHIPFSKRGKTGNYRFSIPGIPSLYLGNTTYACWIELGCPSEHEFNVSPVILDGTQRVLNLAVKTRNLLVLNDLDESYVHCWLKLIVLMIASSYVIVEENRIFKSEYIVSQNIMLGAKELGLDGVVYYSKRVYDEAFANAAINVALFTTYKKGKEYSEICNHLKIYDSFNYSLYKQLGERERRPDYNDYRVLQTGLCTNIGNYKRQFRFEYTDFCFFDKFLFSTWENKDTISFGNALIGD